MPRTKKLTVNITEDVLDLLRELAERSGNSMTQELKKAIADRAYFADKVDSGNEVVLEKQEDGTLRRTLVDLR